MSQGIGGPMKKRIGITFNVLKGIVGLVIFIYVFEKLLDIWDAYGNLIALGITAIVVLAVAISSIRYLFWGKE